MTAARSANLTVAAAITEELVRSGVRHAVSCPGGRSAALAVALATHPALRDWVVTDERSAGFFALGMARELRAPVALVCTSGTAAANLLPAVVEASRSEVPLVVLTADRPPEVRDFGAAQTIDQVRLYGSHVRWSADAPSPGEHGDLERYFRTLVCRAVSVANGAAPGPVHLNLPMREPLVPSGSLPVLPATSGSRPAVRVARAAAAPAPSDLDLLAEICSEERGVIVCGPRAGLGDVPEVVAALAARVGWPLLADPLSDLRFRPETTAVQADGYDLLLRDEAFAAAHRPRAVLQVGAVPVSKPLERLLAAARAPEHVLVASPGTWPDPLHVATTVVQADAAATLRGLLERAPARARGAWWADWRAASEAVRSAVGGRLARETRLFEGKVFGELLRAVPADTLVHVGNSMPVRDLDTFGAAGAGRVDVAGNRGANGIDGVLSTALGAAAVGRRPVVLVVGDLSFLHDLGGLQIAARHRLSALVVVIDNDGGGVFSFLPQAGYGDVFERHFAAPHGLDLAPLAAAAGARVHRVGAWDDFHDTAARACAAPGLDVVVVPSDRASNATMHDEYVTAALAGLRGAEVAA
jgi:2-succinyl-5-enolpyruvyl-6-hydroxy-3-cyclohexene-1-carboxylate synthase